MDEILSAIDDYAQAIYAGDISEIRYNYDFIKLYLMRYRKLKIANIKVNEDYTIIHIINYDEDHYVFGSVAITKERISVGIIKNLKNEITGEVVIKEMEYLVLTKNAFKGSFVDWIFDDSGIEYTGIGDNSSDNNAVCIKTFFNSDSILKRINEEEFEVVKKFGDYPNIKKFNEISKYHLNKCNKTYEDFFVGEYDEVKYINVHQDEKINYSKLGKIIKSISFEDAYDVEKELKDIDNGFVIDNSYLPLPENEEDKKNKDKMLNDKILSLYMSICQSDNVSEEDYIINHLEIIDQVINYMGLNYQLGSEKYNEVDNSYKIPVVYDENSNGWIIVASDGIGLKTFCYDPETDVTTDNEVLIFNNCYSGHISSICVIDSFYKKQVIKIATGFDNYGVLDDEVSIPYETFDLDDRFAEVKLFHQESLEALEDQYYKNSKVDIEEHFIDENINPEKIVLKDGKVYLKYNRRGKK